jgi:crotonobetainyl-CoA:carnitine CoA-transferase CaiB-like acyl-CoA transferase
MAASESSPGSARQDLSLPLAGISAVECGQGVAAAYGAKLLAMLGADVIKVEPPGGDLTRNRGPYFGDAADINQSGLFLYLNADKKGVTLDLADRGERARLDTLLARADILIHNIAPRDRLSVGMDNAAVSQTHPALTVAGISPFGDYGPYAHYHAYEISAAHASGMASLAPAVSQFPDRPPLKLFGHQAEFQAGAFAAMASLAAWLYWAQTGIGQAIEVSEQECLATMLEGAIPIFSYTGRSPSRLGHHTYGPRSIWPTRDGWIFINPGEEEQWQRLVELMGNPEWASDDLFKDRLSRGRNMDALKALMSDWIAGWKVQDLYQAAQNNRVPFAPINTMRDLYENPHLKERDFFVQLDQPGVGKLTLPGMPSRYGATPWSIRRPAPRLGQHSEEVFCNELGVTKDHLNALRNTGVA